MVQMVPELKSLEKHGSALNGKMVPEGVGPEPSCRGCKLLHFTEGKLWCQGSRAVISLTLELGRCVRPDLRKGA